MNHLKLSAVVLAATGLLAAGAASAQSRTYNFSDRNIAGAPAGGCNTSLGATTAFTGAVGNTILCQQAGNASTTLNSQTLSVGAWSSDGSSATYRTAAVNDQGGSGFGIWNQSELSSGSTGSPNHSADNGAPGGADMWQLNFSTAQALRSVTLGWAGADGDFQVLRWGGSGAATSVSGRTAAQLLTDGWVLMNANATDNVFNGTTAEPQTFNFNSALQTSTSWLISAYNSSWVGTGSTTGIDEIKLLGVVTGVSAPGTLALAGLGLLGAAFLRRRNG